MMICKACRKKIPDGSVYCLHCGFKVGRAIRKRAKGEGTVYRIGSRWAAEVNIYRTGLRLRAKRTFKTQAEAVAALPRLREIALGRKSPATTLEGLYVAWQATKKETLSQSKQTAYRIAYDRVPDQLRSRRIDEIGTVELQDLLTGLSYYQARDVKTILSHLYKIAISEDQVHYNLADNLVLPPLQEKEQEAFQPDEIAAFWELYSQGDLDAGYVLLMIYTGMMPGELQACTKDMIDLDQRTISGAGLKTATRKRLPISLPSSIVPVCESLIAASEGPRLWPHGKNAFYMMYKRVIQAAGVRPLPAYSCRHTTATALVEQDVELAMVQRAMRHANVQTTTRYIHPDSGSVAESLESITTYLPSENKEKR